MSWRFEVGGPDGESLVKHHFGLTPKAPGIRRGSMRECATMHIRSPLIKTREAAIGVAYEVQNCLVAGFPDRVRKGFIVLSH